MHFDRKRKGGKRKRREGGEGGENILASSTLMFLATIVFARLLLLLLSKLKRIRCNDLEAENAEPSNQINDGNLTQFNYQLVRTC